VTAGLLLLLATTPVAGAASIGRSSDAVASTAEAMQSIGAAKAYVGLFKDNAVAVLDTGTRQVLRTIPVPAGPHGLVITPDGAKVFVSSDGASTVSVIDTTTDTIVDAIDVGQTPHGLAISPDGREVLVAGFGTNQAEIIDTTSDRIIGRVPVPQPHNSAISPDSRRAYVGSQQQGETALVAVDLTSMTRTGSVPLDKSPRALSFSPDGRWVYFTVAGSDAVQVLDAARNEVVGQIAVGVSPHLPTFTPDGQLGLVVAQGPGEPRRLQERLGRRPLRRGDDLVAVIEHVAEDLGLGHPLPRQPLGELGVERRLEQGLAAEPRQLVGVDRVEDLPGQRGQRVPVAGQAQQAELPGGAEAARERVRLDVLVPQRRGDRGGRQAVQAERVDRLAELDRLGQADARVARAPLSLRAARGRRGRGVVGVGHGRSRARRGPRPPPSL